MEQWSPVFLAPGTSFVEASFSTEGEREDGSGGNVSHGSGSNASDGSGGNASDGERQMKLHSLA